MNHNYQPHSIFSSPEPGTLPSSASHDRPSSRFKAPIREEMTTGLDVLSRWIWWILTINGAITALSAYILNTGTSPVTGEEATPLALLLFGASIFCGAISGILGFSLPIIAYMNYRNSKQIDKMRRGEYFTRWDLDRDQWLAFIKDEKAKAKELVSTTLTVVGALGLLLGIPFYGFLGFFGYVTVLAAMCGFGFLLGKLLTTCRRWRVDRWKDKPFFTVIGYEGLFFNNAYYPYSSFGYGLGSVNFTETDSMSYLEFTFYTQTQNGRSETERRVPIPFGQEEEAKQILKQL